LALAAGLALLFPAAVLAQPGVDCNCDESVDIQVITGDNPQELIWNFTSSGTLECPGERLFKTGGPYDPAGTYTETVSNLCSGQEYTYQLFDFGSDGLAMGSGFGNYTLTMYDTEVLFGDGDFGSLGEGSFFAFAAPTTPPTPAPTGFPTQYPTSFPTDSHPPTLAPTVVCGDCDQTLKLVLFTDSDPDELNWGVSTGSTAGFCSDTVTYVSSTLEENSKVVDVISEKICAFQEYTFVLTDSGGDGILDDGNFTLYLDDVVKHTVQGTSIGSGVDFTFVAPLAPTPSPTAAPTTPQPSYSLPPTPVPIPGPTAAPTPAPSISLPPTPEPSSEPTQHPTPYPTPHPTPQPTVQPTESFLIVTAPDDSLVSVNFGEEIDIEWTASGDAVTDCTTVDLFAYQDGANAYSIGTVLNDGGDSWTPRAASLTAGDYQIRVFCNFNFDSLSANFTVTEVGTPDPTVQPTSAPSAAPSAADGVTVPPTLAPTTGSRGGGGSDDSDPVNATTAALIALATVIFVLICVVMFLLKGKRKNEDDEGHNRRYSLESAETETVNRSHPYSDDESDGYGGKGATESDYDETDDEEHETTGDAPFTDLHLGGLSAFWNYMNRSGSPRPGGRSRPRGGGRTPRHAAGGSSHRRHHRPPSADHEDMSEPESSSPRVDPSMEMTDLDEEDPEPPTASDAGIGAQEMTGVFSEPGEVPS